MKTYERITYRTEGPARPRSVVLDANLGRVVELLFMPNLPEHWERWLNRNLSQRARTV